MNPQFQHQARLQFARSGGVRQARLQSARILPLLADLDAKLWLALSCPAGGHEMDDRTLAALDADADGRVRVRDVCNAIRWLDTILCDLAILEDGNDCLSPAQLSEDNAEGQALAATVRQLLALPCCQGPNLDLAALERGRQFMESGTLNGDGFIPPSASDDPTLQFLIRTITMTIGHGSQSKAPLGATADSVAAFYAACEAFAKWHAYGHSPETHAQLFCLGTATEAAFKALTAVESKIHQWFDLAQTMAFAPDLVSKALQADALDARPLAALHGDAPLPLTESVNPAWRERLQAFVLHTVHPLLGKDVHSLSIDQWHTVLERLAPFRKWQNDQPGSLVCGLGIESINEWLRRTDLRSNLERLIATDRTLQSTLNGINSVRKLLLLKRDFWEFAHNFVNFDRFFAPHTQAIFQVGTLYLDGRSFHLCVPVASLKAHTDLAAKAGLFLLYCEITRCGNAATSLIAAAVTNGSQRRLLTGKHGIFYDREGLEWDARIIQIVEHPINLSQAVSEPFRRMGSLLISQIEKLSRSREGAFQAEVLKGVSAVEADLAHIPVTSTPPQPDSKPATANGMGGLLAGGGVAVAALMSSLALLTSTLAKVNPLYLLLALASVVTLILAPTALVAWLRLRSRDIGLLLEASGWAINAPMRLSRKLGAQLTRLASR